LELVGGPTGSAQRRGVAAAVPVRPRRRLEVSAADARVPEADQSLEIQKLFKRDM